jgi:hypothetical protein
MFYTIFPLVRDYLSLTPLLEPSSNMVILRSDHIITNSTPHVYGRTVKDLETQRNKRKRAVTKIKKVESSKMSLRSSNLKIVPQDLVDSQWRTPDKLQSVDTPDLDPIAHRLRRGRTSRPTCLTFGVNRHILFKGFLFCKNCDIFEKENGLCLRRQDADNANCTAEHTNFQFPTTIFKAR